MSELDSFLTSHSTQLISSCVPEHLWPSLLHKLQHQVFDAGTKVSLLREEDEQGDLLAWHVAAIEQIDAHHPNSIFLVDHAWTFRVDSARQDLQSHPSLLQRMLNLLDANNDFEDRDSAIEFVMEHKWPFSNVYWHGNAISAEDRVPLWYICDELGARINHSDAPNARLVPFMCGLDNTVYSLLFFTQNVEESEEITIDKLEGPNNEDPWIRKALMNIWSHVDLSDQDSRLSEPDQTFFESGRVKETLPDEEFEALPLPEDRKLKVWAEYEAIRRNLKHHRFELTDDESEADILWKTTHFKDFKGLSETRPGCRINQFPCESVVTTKDLLAIVSRRVANKDNNKEKNGGDNEKDDKNEEFDDDHPEWLPQTFNLRTELMQFVSCYQKRAKMGLDNHWIIKPWNLARGLDTHISSNLAHILRLSLSGPKICQKYLSDPVLFFRDGIGNVKFDVRYIILLQSVKPLRLFAYKRFWLRFANVKFDLSQLDLYEKHFTVMNYNEAELKQMFCQDFISEFERQHPQLSWAKVESSIFSMLKAAFEGAAARAAPCGLTANPQSGAMYAVDLMLEWKDERKLDVVPKLLEVNWGPDCERACDYYPDFFDNVFATLFLKEDKDQNVELL